jgi:acetyl esterase
MFLHKNAPPTVMYFGTADKMLDQGSEYVEKAKGLGVRAELHTATEMPHGFFNRAPWTQVTARQADVFLTSLGYLAGEPAIQLAEGAPKLQH